MPLNVLVVGIGNVGKDFESTRHNVGFDVVDMFASSFGASFKRKDSFLCDISLIENYNEFVNVIIAKPTTMVNDSGKCVKILVDKFLAGKDLKNLVVVSDNTESALGKTTMRFGGSHKGHNGIKNIINSLSSFDFFKILVGIGRPLSVRDLSGFVLGKFEEYELEKLNQAKTSAIEILKTWISERNNVL